MSGIFLIIFLLVWGAIALLIANFIGKKLLKRITKDTEGRTTSKGASITLVLSVMVFFAPIADEIIAYPTYSKMCQGAGEFQFSSGMDEKKVFGREVYSLRVEEYIMLFPNRQTLSKAELQSRANENKTSGVVAIKTIDKKIDNKTGEEILSIKKVKPISSMFAFPDASGGRNTWILKECGLFGSTKGKSNPDFYKALQLKQVEGQIDNYILKEE